MVEPGETRGGVAPEEVEYVRYRCNAFQDRIAEALATEKKIVGVFGGWRSGKTDYVALEHVVKRQLYENGDVVHLIAANTYGQLFDSTLKVLYEKLDALSIPRIPQTIPKAARPFSLFIWNGDRWVEFLCRSMENISIVAGTTLGSAWLDEVWNTEKWTYELVHSRLSDKDSRHLQLVLTTTKDEPMHWMYTEIVQRATAGARDEIELVEGTTYDNEQNLVAGYIRGLKATLDPRIFARFVENKWIALAAGEMFYNFDRNLHMDSIEIDRAAPIIVSSDFNVAPMCWSVWQSPAGRELVCVDQLKIDFDADTELAAREIVARYPWASDYVWCGDATGRARSTKSKRSDYEIIQDVFREERKNLELRVPRSNPSVRDSANAVNSLLRSKDDRVRMYFDRDRCPDVILSVEGARYRPGTLEKDDSADADPHRRDKTHFADTVRYVAAALFPLNKPATWKAV